MEKIPFMTEERKQLQVLQQYVSEHLPQRKIFSHIFPFLIGNSEKSTVISEKLKELGYYALPIRPPTVPEGTARIRISLTAQLTVEEMGSLMEAFRIVEKNV